MPFVVLTSSDFDKSIRLGMHKYRDAFGIGRSWCKCLPLECFRTLNCEAGRKVNALHLFHGKPTMRNHNGFYLSIRKTKMLLFYFGVPVREQLAITDWSRRPK